MAHLKRFSPPLRRLAALMAVCPTLITTAAQALELPSTVFPRPFSPLEGSVAPPERSCRDELCLNGLWQFQPCKVPSSWKPDKGEAPLLPAPTDDAWESTPIRIPSTWNINAILDDPTGGAFDARSFPSYPASWNKVKMGWLRRSFDLPAGWSGRRVLLHLEAVAGDCQVLVNGTPMGSHFDMALPWELDITSALKPGTRNEIRLGIRHRELFDLKGTYGRSVVPLGSFWLDRSVGVWQDVFLVTRPETYIQDVQVLPSVAKDLLQVTVAVHNASSQPATVAVEVPVHAWINHAQLEGNPLTAPEPNWELGAQALRLTAPAITLAPGATQNVTLSSSVGGKLKTWEVWSRGKPELSMAVAELKQDGTLKDVSCARFGWRDITLAGGEIRLNGKRIQLPMDGWHFTGVGNMTRRHAWAWYTLAKEANVQFVRPHAMPWPRYYYDVADEMGMLLLDETGLFGSSINLNYDSDAFWKNSRQHVADLVRRDRNHPSVVGWSVSNEVWCVLRSRADETYSARIYDHLKELCDIAQQLDPTRNWVQSDGDRDLNGRFGIRTLHTGGDWDRKLDITTIPWGVTEGGSSYYGKASYYEPLVGDRAYRHFEDRMDGLAIECYQLVRELRKADADIFNCWNLVWHAQKPLPLGLSDRSKPAMALTDGIAFQPYVEGRPGIQPERLAPWSLTLNPGYDPKLPLHDPWPLHHALVAAFAPEGPKPCVWDKRPAPVAPRPAPTVTPSFTTAGFLGAPHAPLHDHLQSMGVTLAATVADSKFLILDAATSKAEDLATAKQTVAGGGTALVLGINAAALEKLNAVLPETLTWKSGNLVSLLASETDPRTSWMSHKSLYFQENVLVQTIAHGTLGGAAMSHANVLLSSNNTDWSRWLKGGEHNATIGIARSEQENTSAPVLAEIPVGAGRWLIGTLATDRVSEEHLALYRQILSQNGLALQAPKALIIPAFTGTNLTTALCLGRFPAASLEAALATPFIPETSARPITNESSAKKPWKRETNQGDRFTFHELHQSGPTSGAYAVYMSFWVSSAIDLTDLLGAGPDLPQPALLGYASRQQRVWLNGNPLTASRTEKVDYRQSQRFPLPLRQGWNHILVKVASDSFNTQEPGTLGMRLACENRPEYLKTLKTAIEHRE